ncbi:hypothetical protein LWI29_015109 [Acer saccharum]|uniref:Chitinase II/V-like catalytic domain-containing protein n=1 Tax=Acer saccharum TaxID=4024 RepID=A0AA39RKW9_ACESA|nr:hypothetical protein LWI29_015109 [Acer saccharum]
MKFFQPLTLFKEVSRTSRQASDMKQPGRFLCTHFGRGYVGLSHSDWDGAIVDFLAPVRKKKLVDKLQELIPRYNVEALVVAYHPSIRNRVKPNGAQVKGFIDDMCKIEEFKGLKYTYWDETLISKNANCHKRLIESYLRDCPQNDTQIMLIKCISDIYEASRILKTYLNFARFARFCERNGELLSLWTLEARNSSKSELIMTVVVDYSPDAYLLTYPIDLMQRYLNWIHVDTSDSSTPEDSGNFTAAPSALYDPTNIVNTDSANGPAISDDGVTEYNQIKIYNERFKAHVMYNSTNVVNYCSVETAWIGFDDVEAIRAKVSYAKDKGLLGYYVWQVSYDANWVLSQAAG